MAKVDIKDIQKLRKITGLGMLACKNALEESKGNIDKAIENLRKKGASVAAKRADKDTGEGLVFSYIHPGDQVGVLLELNCETDFVARTKEIKDFAKDLCLQITALKPSCLNPEDVSPELIAKEREILTEQMKNSGKPEKIIDGIVAGKLKKLYSEICLTKQNFIKECVQELIAQTGENICIKRFTRFEIGA